MSPRTTRDVRLIVFDAASRCTSYKYV